MKIKLEILSLSNTELLIKLVSLEDVAKQLFGSSSNINGYKVYFSDQYSSDVYFNQNELYIAQKVKAPIYQLINLDSKEDKMNYHQFLLELQRKYS